MNVYRRRLPVAAASAALYMFRRIDVSLHFNFVHVIIFRALNFVSRVFNSQGDFFFFSFSSFCIECTRLILVFIESLFY